MKKEKKIPRKNYIIYAAIVAFTIVVVIYATEWYKAYKQNELENSYISKYINEIKYDEFDNYVLENPDKIIYIGKTNCEKCIQFEKNFYKVIKDNELLDQVVFFNIENEDNINKITSKYNVENLSNEVILPSIAILRNSKITDILNSTEENIITDDLIDQLLEEYEYKK